MLTSVEPDAAFKVSKEIRMLPVGRGFHLSKYHCETIIFSTTCAAAAAGTKESIRLAGVHCTLCTMSSLRRGESRTAAAKVELSVERCPSVFGRIPVLDRVSLIGWRLAIVSLLY